MEVVATSTCTYWVGRPESKCTQRLKLELRRRRDLEELR